jgi:3'-phosphoadenosine 5'-phosphosulfate sulfotransferase (PAPS reductase)/FAD synthetase
MTDNVRHILSMSGGKDSTALALYMRDRQENMEYIFCDTKKELQETYDYLNKVEALLGKPIIRLHSDRGFDHWLEVYGDYLPSPQMRWCTRQLKIVPFEQFVGDDPVVSYVGIRADEPDRVGYISTNSNISVRYPFKEDGLGKADVLRILQDSGLGLPEYYKWRTRSGCYFCFFQRKSEWVGLKTHHPDLYEEAKTYEKNLDTTDPENKRRYTWSQSESLEELERPERRADIEQKLKVLENRKAERMENLTLAELFARDDPNHHEVTEQRRQEIREQMSRAEQLEEAFAHEDDGEEGCLICHL